jgi:hypothetical protein
LQISDAQLAAGDELSYKITKAKVDNSIDDNEVSKNGFRFNGKNYPSGTRCLLTINFVDVAIYGDITIGVDNQTFSYLGDWFINTIPHFMIYTTSVTNKLVENWNYINFSAGVVFNLYPYIQPTQSNLEFFSEITDDFITYFESISTQYPNLNFQYLLKEKSNQIYYESWIGGEINGLLGSALSLFPNYQANTSISNHFHITVDKSSGLIKGFGYKGSVKGILNNQTVSTFIEFAYKIGGYCFPNYQLGPYRYLGLKIGVPIGVVVFAGISSFFIIRRRKKRGVTP